jgi:large repetitive protein
LGSLFSSRDLRIRVLPEPIPDPELGPDPEVGTDPELGPDPEPVPDLGLDPGP